MRRMLCVLAWAHTALVCGAVAAQEPADPRATVPSVTMIVATGDQDEVSKQVVRAVQGQLSDLDVTFRLSPVERLPGTLREQIALSEQLAGEPGALAVFWCDLENPEQVFLYLRGTEGDRILVRKLEEPDTGGMSEALAIIVRASVGELLRGGRVGVAVAEVVAAEPPPPPALIEPVEEPPTPGAPPPRPRVVRVMHRVGYVFETYSAEQPATHGLGLGLGIRLHPNIWIDAGYTLAGTLRKVGETAEIRLRRHPIRLGLGVAFPVWIFEIGASVAGVLDYVSFEVRGLKKGMAAVEDRDDVLFSVLPAFEARMRFFPRLHLMLALGVEIPIRAAHYVAQSEQVEEVLLDAWPAQPWVFAGLAIDLW